jgi:hypothetical protein
MVSEVAFVAATKNRRPSTNGYLPSPDAVPMPRRTRHAVHHGDRCTSAARAPPASPPFVLNVSILQLPHIQQPARQRQRLRAGQPRFDLLLVRRPQIHVRAEILAWPSGGCCARIFATANNHHKNKPQRRQPASPPRSRPTKDSRFRHQDLHAIFISFRIFFHKLLPFALRPQNQFHRFAHRAATAGVFCVT